MDLRSFEQGKFSVADIVRSASLLGPRQTATGRLRCRIGAEAFPLIAKGLDRSSPLKGQSALVCEERWRTARVNENHVVVRLPPSCAYQRNQTSKPLAGVDGIKHESFQGSPQFDGLDRRVMWDPIGRPSVTGDDLHVRLMERHLQQVGSGVGVFNDVGSYPLRLSIDVDPDHARSLKGNRYANQETGLCC